MKTKNRSTLSLELRLSCILRSQSILINSAIILSQKVKKKIPMNENEINIRIKMENNKVI